MQKKLDEYCPDSIVVIFQHGQMVPMKRKTFEKELKRNVKVQ